MIWNTEAYNDATKTASDWFLTWDILEDMMPFLPQPAVNIDIQWTKSDLEQKVQELCLEKQQIVILINPSQLNMIPQDSVVLGSPPGISSLLDPTRVVMDATLSNLQEVGDGFLSQCHSLQEVDLGPLSNAQEVGDRFLHGCLSLKEVNLGPLSNARAVGGGFLSGCSSLKVVNFSVLLNVQKVGANFLGRCPSLKVVDLSSLIHVQKVGPYFLYGCSSPTRVLLPAVPPKTLRRAVQGLPSGISSPLLVSHQNLSDY